MPENNSSVAGALRVLYERRVAGIFIVLLLGFLAYSNTFHAPFVLDDTDIIIENTKIRDITNIPDFFMHPQLKFASRPVMHATHALNYYLGGLDPSGYHAFNIAVHLLNGFLLYLLVSITGGHIGYSDEDCNGVALLSMALFVLHPVQTEAVTNTVNRSMLLASTFYFAAMMLFLRAVTAERGKWRYLAGLFIVAFLGMGSRENYATLPIMLALYDACFISGLSIKRMREHLSAYFPIIPGLAYVAFLVFNNTYSRSWIPGGIPPLEYAITELNVCWTYVRLLVLPVNLTLDYDYPLTKTLMKLPVMISLAGYAGLWLAGAFLLNKSPRLSFFILWPLVILFPISFGVVFLGLRLEDVIFEHRLYLPAAGVLVAASSGALSLLRRRPASARVLAVMVPTLLLVFAVGTYARNATWGNELGLWEDALRKAPSKARVWDNKGVTLSVLKRYDEALSAFEKATELGPEDVQAWSNMGVLLSWRGRYQDAIDAFDNAISVYPDYVEAWYNRGLNLGKLGRHEDALASFDKALALTPEYEKAWNDRGIALGKLGRYEEALRSFERALDLKPDYTEALNHRDLVLKMMGKSSGSLEPPKKEMEP